MQAERDQGGGSNFFDALVECVEYLRHAQYTESLSKADVVDGLRARMSIMISRVVSHNTSASMSVRGWEIENS